MTANHPTPSRPSLPALLGAALLAAIALAWAGLIGAELILQAQYWPYLHRDRDFPSYYLAAQRLLHGQDFYSGLQSDAERLGIADYFIDHAVTPPTFAVTTVPLALLPYPAAWGLWQILSLAALAASLHLMVREMRPLFSLPAWVALGGLVLIFPPLSFHLLYAHTELFMLLLLTAAWRFLRRGKETPAGILIGLAGAIRFYPLFLLLLLLQRRAWKALLGTLGSALGLALLAALAAGPTSYLRYLETLRADVPALYPLWGNASLWGTIFKAAALWPALGELPALRDGLAAALSLGILAFTVGLVWREGGRCSISLDPTPRPVLSSAPPAAPLPLDRHYGLYVVAALLASPLSWVYYQVLLYLPLFLLLAALRHSPRPAVVRAVMIASLAASFILLAQAAPGLPGGVAAALSFSLTLPPAGTYVALVLSRPAAPPL